MVNRFHFEMRVRTRLLSIAIFLLLIVTCVSAQSKPTVLLISIDGFRYDYPELAAPKTIQSLIAEGTRADALIPQFPAITFPNHYTIVTGLTPAHHGIVDNTMIDSKLKARFRSSDPTQVTDARWWGGEPIWVTAEKQGQKAGTVFWPGSEAAIGGVRPSYWLPYSKSTSNHERVAKILEWLDLPQEKRPTLLTLYFDEVDTAGHFYGPNSREVKEAIADVDAALGELVAGLKQRGIYDKVDLLLVSDHGMAETSCQRVIDVSATLSREVVVSEHSSLVTISAPPEKRSELEAKLKSLPHVRLYRKEELPPRFAYAGNERIPDMLLLADEGWSIKVFPPKREVSCTGGAHGFDNLLPSQHGIFIARGPSFPEGARIPAFDNLAIYDLMAHLLKLKPAPNDGSLAPSRSILREPVTLATH